MARLRVLSFFVPVALFFAAPAQEYRQPAAAQIAAGMVRGVAADDGLVETFNPALMAEARHFSAAFSATVPYTQTELKQAALKSVCVTKFCSVVAEVTRSGDDASSVTTIGGGIARRFGAFGLGFEYRALVHTLADNLKYRSSYSRFGAFFSPSEALLFSVAAENIENRKLRYPYRDVSLEPVALAALRWRVSDIFTFMCEAEKGWGSDPFAKVAAVLTPAECVWASVGFCTEGRQPTLGAGCSFWKLGVAVGMAYHEELGVTSGATVRVINLWGR